MCIINEGGTPTRAEWFFVISICLFALAAGIAFGHQRDQPQREPKDVKFAVYVYACEDRGCQVSRTFFQFRSLEQCHQWIDGEDPRVHWGAGYIAAFCATEVEPTT